MRDSYLVEVRAGFWGHAFEDLHILDEELASGFDFCQIRTFPPGPAEKHKGQAISPGRIKSHRIGIHTGNLSASNETAGIKLRIKIHASSRPWELKDLQVPEHRCNLEKFRD